MSSDYTTLSLPKDLAEEIREMEGDDTEEKLKSWALQYQRDSEYMTRKEVEALIDEKLGGSE
jgi:hypothetical protein